MKNTIMKNTIKKTFSIIIAATLLLASVFAFASCSKDKPTIAIIQFGTHESLNNCYDGIIEGLKEGGINLDDYNIEHVNSNFDSETSRTQAKAFVNSNVKIIIAIATPSAIQSATAALKSDIPVVYCAVTDATQVSEFENMTGTSDIPDFEAQLELATAFLGKENLKIGVLMSNDESSDPLQIASLKEAAKKYSGMEIFDESLQEVTTSTVNTKIDVLLNKNIDCMINLLDNTVVGQLQTILAKTDAAGIPVFGSEIEQVRSGCLASASIDYITVGKLSGKQAAEILGGKSVKDVKPLTMENETFPCYNSEVLAKFNLKVPEGIDGLIDVIKGE